jgi:hypothetical protein
VPAEDLERKGDGGERADEQERPADGSALVPGEAIGQQETETSAKGHTSARDEAEFR